MNVRFERILLYIYIYIIWFFNFVCDRIFFLPSHHPQAYVGHPQVVQQVGSSDRWNSPSSPSGPALPWLAQDSPGTFNTYTSDISV